MRTRKLKHFIWVTPFTCTVVAPQALVPSLAQSFCNGKQRMSVMFGELTAAQDWGNTNLHRKKACTYADKVLGIIMWCGAREARIVMWRVL